MDFGGSELEAAALTPHERTLRNPDDDYEWWHLDAGQYLIEYNESLTLPSDLVAEVQVRDALRECGVSHPTLSVQSLGCVPLSVGGAGVNLIRSVVTIYRYDRTKRAVDAEQTYNRPYEREHPYLDSRQDRPPVRDGAVSVRRAF